MKLRSFLSVLLGVVLAVLLAGVAGAYWLATGKATPVATVTTTATPTVAQPSAAMFIARQSPLVASLLVNPEQLESFWLTRTQPDHRKALQEQLQNLQSSLFATAGLNYDRDLKSWLGNEVTFAITTPDIDRDAANGLQAGHLLVLTVQDADLARTALQNFWQRRTKTPVTESFAGVELVQSASKPGFTSAMVGDRYVLFANDAKVLRDALNAVQVPELSIERSFDYQQALEKFSEPKLGFIFSNLTRLPADAPISLNWPLLNDASATYESLIAVLQPDAQGVRVDTMLLKAPGAPASAAPDLLNLSQMLTLVPDGASFAVINQDLQATRQQWSRSELARPAWVSPLQQSWTTVQQQWGMQISETILDRVTGPYVIAQIPRSDRPRPDWVLVTQQSPDLQEGLTQLDQMAQQQGMSLGSFELGDQTIYAWTKLTTTKTSSQTGLTSLTAEVQGVRTTAGDYEILATSLEAMQQVLQSTQSPKTTSDLKTAAAQIQTPNAGYFYFSQSSLDALLKSLPVADRLQRQLTASLRSVTLSSYGTDETSQRSVAVLHLKEN
jgi:Protein of unknown function (DUF3352)